jgi:hypothetical protein
VTAHRYDDGIPETTYGAWVIGQHRRAYARAARWRATPDPSGGHNSLSLRCRALGLVFPDGVDGVLRWLGPDANPKSLRACLSAGLPYRGYVFEVVRPRRVAGHCPGGRPYGKAAKVRKAGAA